MLEEVILYVMLKSSNSSSLSSISSKLESLFWYQNSITATGEKILKQILVKKY